MPPSGSVDQGEGSSNKPITPHQDVKLKHYLTHWRALSRNVHKHTQNLCKLSDMAGGSVLPQSQASPTGGLASTMPLGRLEVDKEVHTQLPTSSGSEAQTLLNALEAFIQSNVHDQLAQRGTQKSDEKLGSSESTNHEGLWVDGLLGNAPLNSDSPGEGKIVHSHLSAITIELRFNLFRTIKHSRGHACPSATPKADGWPARMRIQPDADPLANCGPEIKLLERSEVFQHIVLKMRLIDETAFKRMVPSKISKVEQQVIEDLMRKYAGYAVMSHTWLQNEPEVTFSTWPSIQGHRGAGYEKLEGFCKL
ncbi:hypothetical protein BDZ97DRAFT_1921858 [Flammula alnicola]|nr:hypothetical protein BDZ97DRAFT_1921858 [Flammula alnicola]